MNITIKPTLENKINLLDDEVFDLIEQEQERVGHYLLPFHDITKIQKYAKSVEKKHILIIGIGGSTLGTYAVYDFLNKTNTYNKQLHFLESTDPLDITQKLEKIDLEDTFVVLISKSGTTIETISIFKYISSLVTITKHNCAIITAQDSVLDNFAKLNEIECFYIEKNVAGRFSVLSVVGLLPLAIIGVDIEELLLGAQQAHMNYFEKNGLYKRLMSKARFIVEHKKQFTTNVLFSYSMELDGFNKWYIQLWSESLGKFNKNNIHQGFTPIGLLGPTDQHSFLQLLVEGKRDKTITFIKIKNFITKTKIPKNILKGLEKFDFLAELPFEKLINLQADSTIKAIEELENIPYDVIELENIDEYNIAYLLYSYQLLTSIVAHFLEVDAYTQNGVENSKNILMTKLQNL